VVVSKKFVSNGIRSMLPKTVLTA